MVLTDHNIAICWVWVAYIVKLCVCVRYMVVWWCAEVANCPSARVLNAGAFAARAVCGGVVLREVELTSISQQTTTEGTPLSAAAPTCTRTDPMHRSGRRNLSRDVP